VIGGLGVVALRVIMEELAEAEGSTRSDGDRQLRVAGGEAPGANAPLISRSARGARPRVDPAMASPLLRKTLLIWGLRRWKRPKSKALGGTDEGRPACVPCAVL